jgi:hypothetical protein
MSDIKNTRKDAEAYGYLLALVDVEEMAGDIRDMVSEREARGEREGAPTAKQAIAAIECRLRERVIERWPGFGADIC